MEQYKRLWDKKVILEDFETKEHFTRTEQEHSGTEKKHYGKLWIRRNIPEHHEIENIILD